MMEETVIKIEHLRKDYGSGRGVFDVNFEIHKGECFGFLGPNGAGKSTTIRHIMGFSKPEEGKITVFGFDSWRDYAKILRHVGYVPGEIALPTGLNGYQFLEMEQSLSGHHDDERLKALIDYFELSPSMLKTDTRRMSLGVKRKLAIVCAFMGDPDLLVLDEPTSGLDHRMQEKFIAFIHQEKQRGKTILLSSHIFSEVDATCDRIAIIKEGKIVSEFEADALRNASNQTYTIDFESESDARSFQGKHQQFTYVECKEKRVVFVANDKDINDLLKDLATYKVAYFGNKKESLQDYFLKFYLNDKKYEDIQ